MSPDHLWCPGDADSQCRGTEEDARHRDAGDGACRISCQKGLTLILSKPEFSRDKRLSLTALGPPPLGPQGVPFRETHHVAGAAVRLAEDRKCDLSELTLEDLRKLHSEFTEDVMKVWLELRIVVQPSPCLSLSRSTLSLSFLCRVMSRFGTSRPVSRGSRSPEEPASAPSSSKCRR